MSSGDEKVRGIKKKKKTETEQDALEDLTQSFRQIISFSSRLSLSWYTSGK